MKNTAQPLSKLQVFLVLIQPIIIIIIIIIFCIAAYRSGNSSAILDLTYRYTV